MPAALQGNTHDSIEDARTALKLYREYQRLQDAGQLLDKLKDMYAWGKQYGWEPSAWAAEPGALQDGRGPALAAAGAGPGPRVGHTTSEVPPP